PVYHLRNGWYISLYGKVCDNPDWKYLTSMGVLNGSRVKDIATIKVPVHVFDQVDFSRVFRYIEIPRKVVPDLNKVTYDIQAQPVWNGQDLPQGYTGRDVIIGI